MSLARKYKGKDSEMLIISSTFVQAAEAHKAFLITKRANWADPYFSDFAAKIDTAISTYLGVDNAAKLRNQTALLTNIQKPAYSNVSDVKLQIETDFNNDKPRMKELLTTLGYNQYWVAAQAKDQEALIMLLFSFKQNLTPAIQAELVAKGISATYLTDIIASAQSLMDANVSQEFFKQARKTQTDAAITEFNAIYDQAITIAKLSTRFLKDNPAATDQFSYTKALKALNSSGSAAKQVTPTPTPPTP